LDEPPQPDRPGGLSRSQRRIMLAAALCVLVILGLILPAFSILQPGYYERYPDLRERMHQWRASTHAGMTCVGCHVEPGLGSFLGFAARSVPAFYSQLLTGPRGEGVLRAPTRRACRKCHTGYRLVSPAGDLRIPHRAHVEVLKIDCAFCHRGLVHYPSETGYNRPRMSMCLEACHDGTRAANQCVKCHTRKQTPEGHRAADWLETHSTMVDKIDCGSCHAWTPKYCEDCHKNRPKTHVGNWKKLHQTRAKQRGKGCLVCHGGKKFCERCHDK
jgi:hypothetical protein